MGLQGINNDTNNYKPGYKGLWVNTSKNVGELSSLTLLPQVIKGNYEPEHSHNISGYASQIIIQQTSCSKMLKTTLS